MKKLLKRYKDIQLELSLIESYMQNDNLKYDDNDMDNFDIEVKTILKELGVWKTDMLMLMEDKKDLKN